MFSVPWRAVDDVLGRTGSLDGKVVIDTTNQYGSDGLEQLPKPAAQINQERMPGARLVKSFNTMTSTFQGEAPGRGVAIFLAGEDDEAKQLVAGLIRDIGFEPVDVGGWAGVSIMEAPRRDGACRRGVLGRERATHRGRAARRPRAGCAPGAGVPG